MAKPNRKAMLDEAAAGIMEVSLGHGALVDRVNEWAGGYPGGGDGGGSVAVADPNAQVHERRDPADQVFKRYDEQLFKTLREVNRLVAIQRQHVEARPGVATLSDPGCELCGDVPRGRPDAECRKCGPVVACWDHGGEAIWSASYVTTEVTGTGKRATPRRLRACYWCFRFRKNNGRLPTKDERKNHHEGKTVRVRP